MKKSEMALACFKERFNCSQAILSVYGAEFGISRDIALKVACPFGAGMGRMSEACGAVTGAFMVIGLKYGNTEAKDISAKGNTYQLVNNFADKFKARNGTINCRELLGCDLGTPEGMKFAVENKLIETRCTKFVVDAAEILEEIL